MMMMMMLMIVCVIFPMSGLLERDCEHVLLGRLTALLAPLENISKWLVPATRQQRETGLFLDQKL